MLDQRLSLECLGFFCVKRIQWKYSYTFIKKCSWIYYVHYWNFLKVPKVLYTTVVIIVVQFEINLRMYIKNRKTFIPNKRVYWKVSLQRKQ